MHKCYIQINYENQLKVLSLMKKQMMIHWNMKPYIYLIKANRKMNLYLIMKRLPKIKGIEIVGRGLMIIYG